MPPSPISVYAHALFSSPQTCYLFIYSKDTDTGSDQMSKQRSAHQSSKSETDVDKTVIENKTELEQDQVENSAAANSQCKALNEELTKKLNYELLQKKVVC